MTEVGDLRGADLMEKDKPVAILIDLLSAKPKRHWEKEDWDTGGDTRLDKETLKPHLK